MKRSVAAHGRRGAGVPPVADHELEVGFRDLDCGAGQFQLDDSHPHMPLVVAQADGYRTTGQWVRDAMEPIRITLRRMDESAPKGERLVLRLPDEASRHELRKELLAELREAGIRSEVSYWVAESLKRLAPHDPDLVMEHLDEVSSVTRRIPILVAAGRIDEGLALAETVESPHQRTYQYLTTAAEVADPVQKSEILAAAFGHAQSEQDPARRVVLLAKIAESLLELGQNEAAESIVREAFPTARATGTSMGDYRAHARRDAGSGPRPPPGKNFSWLDHR